MLRPRLFHHVQAGVLVAAVLVVAAAGFGIVWLNERGFEGRWGERIEAELSQRGIHADFASVRFSPTRGIIVREVVLYADRERDVVVARVPRLRFDVDRLKAFRGELQIRRVIIHDANLTVPVGVRGELTLNIVGLTGRANLDRRERLILEDATATLGGMKFSLEAELDEFVLADLTRSRQPGQSKRLAEFIRGLREELAHWSFPAGTPPALTLRLEGSAQHSESLRTSFSLAGPELTRRTYTMRDLLVTGELHGRSLAVDRLAFSAGEGALDLQADYDLEDKTGNYQVSSTIKIGDLLQKAFRNDTLEGLTSPHAPDLTARGRFAVKPSGFELNSVGEVEMRFFRFLGVPFDRLDTEFSWQNGDMFLRNLVVEHEAGRLSGQVLMQGDVIRYRARSSLPLRAFREFIREGSGIDRSLASSTFTAASTVEAEAEGTIQRSNLREWDAHGRARVTDFSYNGVALAAAEASFDITPLDYVFTEIETEFRYDDYPPHVQFGGPISGALSADRVHYDAEAKLTYIERARGTAWPGPALRLFAPKVAAHVESSYYFRDPPQLEASGVIDMVKSGPRTDVTAQVAVPGLSDYVFLKRNLNLTNLSATVRIRPDLYTVDDLSFQTFDGGGAGNITVTQHPNRTLTVEGGLSLETINLLAVGEKFEFKKPAPGSLNARIDFAARSALQADETQDWTVTGSLDLQESAYNGVPLRGGGARFAINDRGSTWSEVEVEFDYRGYPPREASGADVRGVVRAEQIIQDTTQEITRVTNLRGIAWPGPVLRLVAPEAAEHVEKSYRFRAPPAFVTVGTIDNRSPPVRTDLTSRIESRGVVDYDFLDHTLQLTAVTATVRTRHHRHEVSDLRFRTFQGNGAGEVTVIERPGKRAVIAGGIKWDELSLAEIGRKYDFDEEAHGRITGRIDFRTEDGNTRALNGSGVIGLRDGQLFRVPIFGPLSIPLGGILGKQFSHEQARDASATFVIKDGVAHTNDFLTSTPSTVFTGGGRVDFATKRLDMTVRMNARGLLGLVTLPLLPFNGLFQFRGTGPVDDPAWNPAPFTQPARGPDDPIFREPGKAQIVPER